jgi:hypothetical protein
MMILLPFLLSFDSLFASFVLGVPRVGPSRQIKLAAAFGVCDGVASLIHGALNLPTGYMMWPDSHQFHLAVGFFLVAVSLACLLGTPKLFGCSMMWTVPVVLSIDNLVAPGVERFSVGSVCLVIIASSSMSLVGFRLGTLLGDFARKVTSQPVFFRNLAP